MNELDQLLGALAESEARRLAEFLVYWRTNGQPFAVGFEVPASEPLPLLPPGDKEKTPEVPIDSPLTIACATAGYD